MEKAAGTDTAVFAASMNEDYLRIVSKDPDEVPRNTATGTDASILANRISWYFNLKGPSIQLNTACSSSLVAVDLACQSLRSGSNLFLQFELTQYITGSSSSI
jgi:acyl transferase domain-containing protein